MNALSFPAAVPVLSGGVRGTFVLQLEPPLPGEAESPTDMAAATQPESCLFCAAARGSPADKQPLRYSMACGPRLMLKCEAQYL